MKTELGVRWGEQLRAFRTTKGLTQQQLAEATGVTNATICRWELGQALPRPHHQIAVSQALGVPPTVIFRLS